MSIKGTTVYRTIRMGRTQRATAEAIQDYLDANQGLLPLGARRSGLVIRLSDSYGPECIQFCDFNGLNLTVWPASTTEIQADRGWAANWGDRIGRGVLVRHPKYMAEGDRGESIRFIRLAIGRTLRYHAAEIARVEKARALRLDSASRNLILG